MKINKYKDLIVWQKSMQVAEALYRLAKRLPKEETYALSDQMRRAAVSIPSNIAEGYGRNSKKEYAYFLSIAKGSLNELETQLLLCVQVKYLKESDVEPVLETLSELGKMLTTIILKLKTTT